VCSSDLLRRSRRSEACGAGIIIDTNIEMQVSVAEAKNRLHELIKAVENGDR